MAEKLPEVNRRGHLRAIELALLTLLATTLRVFRLEAESYWLDEAFSVTLVTSRTVSELLFRLPGNEPHPPLYNLLLYGWTGIFGTSEFATRLLSAIFGIVVVIVVYEIGRWLFDRQVGLTAALLVAVSPFHIWYSQETRMYSLLTLLTAISFYWFIRVTVNERSKNTVAVDDLGYVLSTILLGYTHVFGLFVILTQNSYVVSRHVVRTVPRSRLSVRRWVALQGSITIFLTPWLATLVRRVAAAHGGDAGNVSWIPTPTAETVRDTFASYLGGYLLDESLPLLLLVLVTVCLLFVLSGDNRLLSDGDQHNPLINARHLLVLWVVIPILIPVLISYTVSPIYMTRYSIGGSLAFLLLIAKGVQTISYPSLQYLVIGLLVVGLVLPLPTYYENDQKEQWREVATQVESNADGNDVVLISKPWTKTPFDYYFERQDVKIVQLKPEVSATEIQNRIEGREDVWIVFSYTTDSTEQKIREVVQSHPEYRGPVEAKGYIGIVVYRFERTSN